MDLENEARTDSTVRRYLLGRLGDGARLRLERHLAADDDILTRLGGVEHELVRDFLRGGLSWWDERRFRQRLRSSSDLQGKTETARAIAVALSPIPGTEIGSSGASPQRARLPPSFGPALGFALVLVAVFLCANTWLSMDDVRLRREIGRLRAEAERVAAPAPVFSFVLFPGSSKGDSTARRLLLTGDRGQLQLRLEIPDSARNSHYRAGLRSVEQASEVWSGMAGSPARTPSGLFVEIQIPIAGLAASDYLLSPQAQNVAGDWEEVESYSFAIDKR